jgi:hypothetical protein
MDSALELLQIIPNKLTKSGGEDSRPIICRSIIIESTCIHIKLNFFPTENCWLDSEANMHIHTYIQYKQPERNEERKEDILHLSCGIKDISGHHNLDQQ